MIGFVLLAAEAAMRFQSGAGVFSPPTTSPRNTLSVDVFGFRLGVEF